MVAELGEERGCTEMARVDLLRSFKDLLAVETGSSQWQEGEGEFGSKLDVT